MNKEMFIPIVPQPWRRTSGNGKRRYTEEKTRAYKKELAQLVKNELLGVPPTKQAVTLALWFQMPIPKSWTKSKKLTPPDHISTPDTDNMTKAVKDALNGIVWVDDAQVNNEFACKVYSDNPGIKIQFFYDDV